MTTTEQLANLYDRLVNDEWTSYARTAEHFPYALPQNAMRFDNISDMRRRVISSGSHYFDPAAIRFFKGKTDGHLYGGRFWVESRGFEDEGREYMIASAYLYGEGHITIEKLGSFDSMTAARNIASDFWTVVRDLEGVNA